jgi:hypothetical protein
MKKRFNIVVINSDRIDGFLNNFEKKIRNFDRKVDFITLLDASKKNEDSIKFKRFLKKRKIKNFVIRRNSNGLDHAARLEFFTMLPNSINFKSSYIIQFQDNTLEDEALVYKDGSKNFDIRNGRKVVRNDNMSKNIKIDLKKMSQLFVKKKLDGIIFQNQNAYYAEVYGNRFIAPHGGNFVIRTSNLLKLKNQVLMNLMLNESKFFGPTFSRNLISERGEKWVLWMEFTWGLLLFNENSKVYDLNRKSIISFKNKRRYKNVSELYSNLYKRFVEFNKVSYVDYQKSKFIYHLKLIKQTFLLLYRGFTT